MDFHYISVYVVEAGEPVFIGFFGMNVKNGECSVGASMDRSARKLVPEADCRRAINYPFAVFPRQHGL